VFPESRNLMKITVTISDELAAQAEARGLSVEIYVQSLVEEAGRNSLLPHLPRTPEQIEAFFEAMAEGSQKLPLLPTESFTRASFYQDRNRAYLIGIRSFVACSRSPRDPKWKSRLKARSR
jgi:hypothetical protein